MMATETAINIGYSSKLLVEEMRVFIINAEDKDSVRRQLTRARLVHTYCTLCLELIAIPYACFRDEIVSCEDGSKTSASEAPTTEGDLKLGPPGPPFGIVINGTSLVRFA